MSVDTLRAGGGQILHKSKHASMPTSQVAFARLTQTSVRFYNAQGSLLKGLTCQGAVSAQPTGDGIAVTMKNGNVKLYDRNGSLVKIIG